MSLKQKLPAPCYRFAKWGYHFSRLAWCVSKLRQKRFLREGEADRLIAFKDLFRGQRCFIIGNGPSLKEQDLSLLQKEQTFVCNWFPLSEQFEQLQPKHYCVCTPTIFNSWKSPEFNKELHSLLKKGGANMKKWLPFDFKEYIEKNQIFDSEEVFYLLSSPRYRTTTSLDKKEWMNLDLSHPVDHAYSVIIEYCLPIAFHLGFREIYLLGCDCNYFFNDEGAQYFYPEEKHTSEQLPLDTLEKHWGENGRVFTAYAVAKKTFERHDCKIYNATKGGCLEIFPRVNYEDIV